MDKTARKFLQNELQEHGVLPEDINSSLLTEKQMLALASRIDKIDPRTPKKVTYSASHIMLVALMGVFAGAQTWNQIAEYGKAKIDLVRQFLPLVKESPSHDTLRRFFMIIKPESLESLYREWALGFQGELADSSRHVQQQSSEGEKTQGYEVRRHIAIDGKTICGAIDADKYYQENKEEIDHEYAENARMHIVSAYSVEGGLSLAQERVPVKKNELEAIPRLLNVIDLAKGDVVTIDAMGTHANLAEMIASTGADYLFEVKDNQKNLKKHIALCMDMFLKRRYRTKMYAMAEETLYDHSHTTHRECFVSTWDTIMEDFKEKWTGLSTFGVIKTTKTMKDGTSIAEDHYFITSLPRDPELIMRCKREHWQVENALHWNLDVIFNEDKGRKMMNSAQNYSLLTKMALAILKKDKKKIPLTDKRMLAGWNDKFMQTLVNQFVSNF